MKMELLKLHKKDSIFTQKTPYPAVTKKPSECGLTASHGFDTL